MTVSNLALIFAPALYHDSFGIVPNKKAPGSVSPTGVPYMNGSSIGSPGGASLPKLDESMYSSQ